jgi:Peptidase A4 family
MKLNLARLLCGAALAVAVTSGPVAAQHPEHADGSTHLPMQPYHNPDGSFVRGFRGGIITGSWGGYAVTTGAPYTSASGTWQVANVSYDGGYTPYGSEYMLTWVGIGGDGDSTLIQLGTEAVVSTSGATFFYVWYELYPAGAALLPQTVHPGDIITASLQCTAACSAAQVQTWQLTINDETLGWTWTKSVQYQSSMGSAEWIIEPPYYNSFAPLADYGQLTFDPVEANGANPNLSLSANAIIMEEGSGQTSNPSAPVGGDVFSVCWGNPSLTPCTAGSFTTPPPAAPTASLSANPKSITTGQSSTLSWSATNASSCIGSGFDSASQTAGSAIVKPAVTTAYAVKCTGEGGSATATATVTAIVKPIDGHCGSSNGQHLTSAPTTNLCSSGVASAVSSTGQTWSWSCAGLSGGHTQQCSASLLVNGQCGAANGVATNKAPSSGLCAAGTASGLGGSGPWNWNCNGSNGGKNASCSAPL